MGAIFTWMRPNELAWNYWVNNYLMGDAPPAFDILAWNALSSASALGNRGRANYSAAKAGIQGFTRTLEIKLGPFGITANSIAPGFIETAMTEVRSGKPVTNQVTTVPGNGRHSATYPTHRYPLNCSNQA